MHLRSFSVAVASAAVASSAYYFYRNQADGPSYTQTRGLSATNVYSDANTAGPSVATPEEAAASPRRAVVVGPGSLYTGTITGDGPLSKETDDYGRKVLEMMTPEQATQKLRKNEESWSIGRGAGVVRYDVVQIPSNDPIEDDHAEKIIEVPSNVAASTDGSTNSDWMFWGVFDGHR